MTDSQSPQPGPVQTDAQILAAARALNKQCCAECGTDEEDSWKLYGNSYIVDAGLALRAAQALDLRDDVIATLRGQVADLQALCDDRGRRLYWADGQATAEGDALRSTISRIVSTYVDSPMLVDELCFTLSKAQPKGAPVAWLYEHHVRKIDVPRYGVLTEGCTDDVKARLQAFPVYRGAAVPAHERVKSWAEQHHIRFVSRSHGQQSTDTISFEALEALAAAQAWATTFQERVRPWLLACFGPEISSDKVERNHRFLEEALELVQACGCTQSEAHQLVDYVFGRPVGEPAQEVGGVMVTLAALCLANDLDMHEAGETELARIWTKVEAIRAKQAAKPEHSPLPVTPSPAPAPALSSEQIERLLADFARNCAHGLAWRRTKACKELRAALTAASPAVQDGVAQRLLRECELFLRVIGLDSEPAAKLAAECRAALAERVKAEELADIAALRERREASHPPVQGSQP